ncbi:TPA: virulence protein [Enterobacter cloacae]|nr:virulence protein [Enterobacter cloacae]
MQNSEQLRLAPPTLPAGGGTITGIKGDMEGAGPDGSVTLSIPLPVSAGRGYAPSLALNYSNRGGNGPFGIGWGLNQSGIRRRTRKGVPNYQNDDEFLGPDGEVLVPLLGSDGKLVQERGDTLLGVAVGGTYLVRVYRSRIEGDFSRFEFWQPDNLAQTDFWVIYQADGQVYLLGKNAQARISNPEEPMQTAQWLQESAVSETGEQIYYQYRSEDDEGCDLVETTAHPSASAQRYPSAIYYGNLKAERTLPGVDNDNPAAAGWLFILVLDYGERDVGLYASPPWQSGNSWSLRPDPFSNYEYGFDLRTRRLCRQALLFHRLATLAGSAQGDDTPVLISRLLFEYHHNPSITTLISVRQLAYEPNDARSLKALPPLEFSWQVFDPQTPLSWQQREDLGNLNPLQPYQFLDLNGEGVAGLLYQDSGAWWYREPIRQSDSEDINAVTWADAKPLTQIPLLRNGATLADLNGDGHLQWVVTLPGGAGYYDRTPAREWLHFTPLSALPVEYAHPRAQLADIIGAGFSDMVLIGPHSVRLYAGKREGWEKGQDVIQCGDIALPIPGIDARTLVAFSDIVGSGQQHLVQVRADGVRYWPNLGRGRFGRCVDMPGFSQPAASFNPDQLFLADIDGSGTVDLIYAHSDRFDIYLNQSGNRFAEPFSVALPNSVRYDRTCGLQVADIQGLGVASLLLSIPHPVPHHWVCHLSEKKPWLLNVMNNNMAASHRFHYRSSAQFWLDEKAQFQGKNTLPCYLPFALHTLWRTETEDEITGNRQVSEIRYRHGVWDGNEREFRGFGYVEVLDTVISASQGTAEELTQPSLARSWFATGQPAVDSHLYEEYWLGDSASFPLFTPLFTTGSGEEEAVFIPDNSTLFWLTRAMKGMLLRSELYDADPSTADQVPYTVTEARLQARLIESHGTYPVTWPTVAETRVYVYERISNDPLCSQDIILARDAFGLSLREVSINYPRRRKPAENPYPDTFPDSLFASSYDEQQQILHVTLRQNSWHHLTDNSIRVLGLLSSSRSDIFTHPADVVPAEGLTFEQFQKADSLIAGNHPFIFAGQQQVWYLDEQNTPTRSPSDLPVRIAFTDIAVFDDGILKPVSDNITREHLLAAGYHQAAYLFARPAESTLWQVRQGYTEYATAEHFWLPVSYRETELTGAVTVSRDIHDCLIIQYQDAAGLTIHIENDYRFLIPVKITDVNDNVSTVALDALGRVTFSRFHGMENRQETGYSDKVLEPLVDMDSALTLKSPLAAAQSLLYVSDSWMPAITTQMISQAAGIVDTEVIRRELLTVGVLTEDGRLRALSASQSLPSSIIPCVNALRAVVEVVRTPPHVLTLVTDRYDSDPAQQIRQQVTFYDGFGRLLQAAVRREAGEAWQYKEDGSLAINSDGTLVTARTNFRWAVTGRTEYDNKGQPVRVYRPYFLDNWRYVSDDSARTDLYADTHFYDPVGREWQVKTAKGWFKRVMFTPWFVVSEDENNTIPETEKSVADRTNNSS